MLFWTSVIVSSNNINVWSCNSVFQFWLVMHYLSEMTEEQTLVMCSGHPQGLFPSSPSAPRAIISNGMVSHISSASVFDTLKKRHYCVISWVCYLVLFLVIKPAKQKILWKNTKHIFFIFISSDWFVCRVREIHSYVMAVMIKDIELENNHCFCSWTAVLDLAVFRWPQFTCFCLLLTVRTGTHNLATLDFIVLYS